MKEERKIWVFEAGSSKSTLIWIDVNGVQERVLSGFNPNRKERGFIEDLKKIKEIRPDDHVFFYGSGCASQGNKEIVQQLIFDQFQVNARVFDDVLGAARAMLGRKKGLFAIMGTGAGCGYFDGENVVERTGGYGYLIDDIGGGLELGKVVVSYWLNGRFNVAIEKEIERYLGCSKVNFIASFYADNDFGKVAGLTKLIADFKTNQVVEMMLIDYFEIFFKRHVEPLKQKYGMQELYITGSLGTVFKNVLKKMGSNHGVEIANTMQFPARELLAFHLNEI